MPARVHNLPRPKRYRDGKAKERLGKNRFTLQIAHWAWIVTMPKSTSPWRILSITHCCGDRAGQTEYLDSGDGFQQCIANKMRGNGLAGSDPNFSAQLCPIRPVSRNVLFSSSSSRSRAKPAAALHL